MEALAGLTVVLTFLAIAVVCLWIVLPFAVFGTKPKIDLMTVELRKLNKTLTEIQGLLSAAVKPASPTKPTDTH